MVAYAQCAEVHEFTRPGAGLFPGDRIEVTHNCVLQSGHEGQHHCDGYEGCWERAEAAGGGDSDGD